MKSCEEDVLSKYSSNRFNWDGRQKVRGAHREFLARPINKRKASSEEFNASLVTACPSPGMTEEFNARLFDWAGDGGGGKVEGRA